MLYLYGMEIIITHKKGVSVTNNAEFTEYEQIIDIKNMIFGNPIKGIKIADLYNIDCDAPDRNDEVEVVADDKIFLCIFVNKLRLDIVKEIEITDKIWQLKK